MIVLSFFGLAISFNLAKVNRYYTSNAYFGIRTYKGKEKHSTHESIYGFIMRIINNFFFMQRNYQFYEHVFNRET